MSTEPIDPAQIMQNHRSLADGKGGYYCRACPWPTSNRSTPHPCEPYRLAKALADCREQEHRYDDDIARLLRERNEARAAAEGVT